MPAAAGAVAAAAVADQMLGPKEDKHLAIVLVFLCRTGTRNLNLDSLKFLANIGFCLHISFPF